MRQTDNSVELGDRVQMRKPHPCGGDEWMVIRTGADVKIKCALCGRVVMLDRAEFIKRRKKLISRTDPVELLLRQLRE